jgi:hypothetical protein
MPNASRAEFCGGLTGAPRRTQNSKIAKFKKTTLSLDLN